MVWLREHSTAKGVWGLVSEQHGVVSREQLVACGLTRRGIEHRIARGRLRPVAKGVYVVGRPDLTQHGRWMAAVLACGHRAVLSHGSAAALLGFGLERPGCVEVSVRSSATRRHPELLVHRRLHLLDADIGFCDRVPVTSPARTLIDLAAQHDRLTVERMVDEADRLGLITPPELRAELEQHPGDRGVARLRAWLDRRTFRLTRSRLERLFLPLANDSGLPVPATKVWVNGFEVDFLWPDLHLIVETDGLRYHRTPAEQAVDRLRDQAHTAAGMTHLRFTHEQVYYEPEHVLAVLRPTARRLLAGA
jgi:very-short-patch-repair endonuclease